jgi:hypothetical protein
MVGLTLLAAVALADPPGPPEEAEDLPISGWAIRPVGGPAATSVSTMFLIGGAGGTDVATVEARVPVKGWQLGVRLPFAAWRTPDAHDTGLGNLAVEAWHPIGPGALGLELTAHLGPQAWTWAQEASDIWPSTGASVAWQVQSATDPLTVSARAALGAYHTPGIEPYPSFYARLSGAIGADVALGDHAGLIGEASAAWWDPSPVDLALGARLDPAKSVRARAGLVFPVLEWAGAGIGSRTTGIEDVGFGVDLTVGL